MSDYFFCRKETVTLDIFSMTAINFKIIEIYNQVLKANYISEYNSVNAYPNISYETTWSLMLRGHQ